MNDNWQYSRNQARHNWWDERSQHEWIVKALNSRGYGFKRQPKIDGYDLWKKFANSNNEIFVEHGQSVKALKARAEQLAEMIWQERLAKRQCGDMNTAGEKCELPKRHKGRHQLKKDGYVTTWAWGRHQTCHILKDFDHEHESTQT